LVVSFLYVKVQRKLAQPVASYGFIEYIWIIVGASLDETPQSPNNVVFAVVNEVL